MHRPILFVNAKLVPLLTAIEGVERHEEIEAGRMKCSSTAKMPRGKNCGQGVPTLPDEN